MASDPGSMAHRRRLSASLRHYRLTTGVMAKPVAEQFPGAPSKIIRIEKGQRLTTTHDIVALRSFHGPAGENTRQELTQPAGGPEPQ